MSGVEAGIWAEGIYLNDRYVSPSEIVICPRCNLPRRGRTTEPRIKLCIDCRTVERETARHATEAPKGRPWTHNGVTTWAVPMSAEDRAWCEKQVERQFWQRWEQLNRRDAVTPAVMQKARDLSRDMSTPCVENQCPPDQQFSTRSVHNGLHENGERVFDEKQSKEGVA